jgi:hypothetical protein
MAMQVVGLKKKQMINAKKQQPRRVPRAAVSELL